MTDAPSTTCLRELFGGLAKIILGRYQRYVIFSSPDANKRSCESIAPDIEIRNLHEDDLATSGNELLRRQASYGGDESIAFAARVDQELAGVCFYWYGERYRTRNFWPLAPDEAKLVQVFVDPRFRDRGVARSLIMESASSMHARGFSKLFARVWPSNRQSRRTFSHAGWSEIAQVFECRPPALSRRIRMIIYRC